MATIPRVLHEHINTAFPAHVCLVATVLPNGFAQVSPRGSTMVFDDDHLALWERGKGSTTANLKDGTKVNFDSTGKQTSVVDTNNNTWTYNYNGSNQLTSITDPYNLNVTFTYTSGLATSITDPASRTATLTYSGAKLASWKDPDNALWQYSYNSSDQLTALTNPRNYTTSFTYNSGGWVTSVTRPDSTTEQLSALQSQDMSLAGSFLMFLAVLTVAGMFLSDVLLAALDPRIRLTSDAEP